MMVTLDRRSGMGERGRAKNNEVQVREKPRGFPKEVKCPKHARSLFFVPPQNPLLLKIAGIIVSKSGGKLGISKRRFDSAI
jgi:hypothetical protein